MFNLNLPIKEIRIKEYQNFDSIIITTEIIAPPHVLGDKRKTLELTTVIGKGQAESFIKNYLSVHAHGEAVITYVD